MIRPATGTSQQSKQPAGANSSYNNNNRAPPGGNFNKTVQQYMNTSGYPGSGASFATGKPPQNVARSAPTSADSTWNRQPQTQTKTFYASNPTSGNVNRAQGSWTPRLGSGSGKSTGTTSGQYRPQNPGGHFQGKGPYDKNQNQNRFSSQKGSSTAGASPTKLVNQLFNEAGKSAAKTKGSCGLISRTRFEVNVIYHAKLIELFKSMSTRLYNSENRRWSFHLKEYETLMNKMGDLRSEIHLEPLPRSILQVLQYITLKTLFAMSTAYNEHIFFALSSNKNPISHFWLKSTFNDFFDRHFRSTCAAATSRRRRSRSSPRPIYVTWTRNSWKHCCRFRERASSKCRVNR